MNPHLWSIPAHVPVKLFFAVRPPPALCQIVEALAWHLLCAHRLTGQVIAAARTHITLAALHDPRLPFEEVVARACQAAARLRHRCFAVRFDRTQSFALRSHSHPLVLRGDLPSLCEFRAALAETMRSAGLRVPPGYTPHITMLWGDRCVGEYPIAPMDWTVESFVLVASAVGYSRHTELRRWPLQHAGAA